MNYDYSSKLITLKQALDLVKPNDYIVTGMCIAEAKDFMSQLHTIADRAVDVRVSNCIPMADHEFFANPEYRSKFMVETWFYTASLRRFHKNGNVTYIPNHLHLAAKKRLDFKKPNIYVGAAAMPDKHGNISLSLSTTYEKQMIEAADITILEINPNFPRTFGDIQVHVKDIDYLVECDYEPLALPDPVMNDKDRKIGKYIADLVDDGSCLQLGIGGIPNAVAEALIDKKDLGVHTEMFSDGMMKLYQAGAITGKYKNMDKGKMIATFAMGSKELYEFLDDNPAVEFYDGYYTNDPYVIAQNDNQISINTTLEVDLTGQCASESLGSVQFSGTGGQSDTAVGAQMSKGGKSFIALYSTAMVRNPETGEKEEISKIVGQLKVGAAVSLSRNDVDYVVTEYGVAALRGTGVTERVERLIAIAHPKFRDELRAAALELGMIYER
ncbi:MAG: acetyl-CoA hydrolase/transferase family protein [Clostridia bacterium]|nr:acetyl-CoA hydrolase/transferase family protein [Clostridia bacterium]